MAFNTYGVKSSSNENTVDWDEINTYVVETAKLQKKETLRGVVSVLCDLGLQEQEDGRKKHDPAISEEEALKEFPDNWFEDGKDEKGNPCRYRCWKQAPIQCVTLAVDFPDIMIDKGQFFGESSLKPLRLYLGSQFYFKDKGMMVARPIKLAENKKLGDWSLDSKNTLHKMALAADLTERYFKRERIDEILGKSFQFEVQIYFKKGKNGKNYYTEEIAFASGLGRGQEPCETLVEPTLIQFNEENDEEALKELRGYIKNTIRHATNYEGSKIKEQLDALSKSQAGSSEGDGEEGSVDDEASSDQGSTSEGNDTSAVVDDSDPFAVE